MTEQTTLPKWILIVSALFALLELMVGIALWLTPQSMLDMVDLGARGVTYLLQMWAARQFALGFIFAFAAYKRSVPMLTIAYLFFLVMFTGDLLTGISQKENSLIFSALVMCIIATAVLWALHRKKSGPDRT